MGQGVYLGDELGSGGYTHVVVLHRLAALLLLLLLLSDWRAGLLQPWGWLWRHVHANHLGDEVLLCSTHAILHRRLFMAGTVLERWVGSGVDSGRILVLYGRARWWTCLLSRRVVIEAGIVDLSDQGRRTVIQWYHGACQSDGNGGWERRR